MRELALLGELDKITDESAWLQLIGWAMPDIVRKQPELFLHILCRKATKEGVVDYSAVMALMNKLGVKFALAHSRNSADTATT